MSPQFVVRVRLVAVPSAGGALKVWSLGRGVPGAVQSRIDGSPRAGSLTAAEADALEPTLAEADGSAEAAADGEADADVLAAALLVGSAVTGAGEF
jgi:hypothetical protein